MKLWLTFIAAIVVATASLCAAPASAQQNRYALVVGIDQYPNLATPSSPQRGQLKKAVNDARAVAKTLEAIGFKVTLVENKGRLAILDAASSIVRRMKNGDIVFVFFSGHGFEIDGANWLVPSDVPPTVNAQGGRITPEVLTEVTLNASRIINAFKAKARVVVAVFDACREFVDADNQRNLGFTGGLAKMDASEGTYILYSAGAGQFALDRLNDQDTNPNSVFTRVLLPMLGEQGLTVTALAEKVGGAVRQLADTVNHDQRPAFYYDVSSEPFVLVPAPRAAPQVAALPQRRPAPTEAGPKPPAGACADAPVLVALAQRRPAALSPQEECALKPKDVFKECDLCPEMVVLPAKPFLMGSSRDEEREFTEERPQHTVTIARPFAVGRFEVTVDEFSAFVRATAHRVGPRCMEGGRFDELSGRSWQSPGYPQSVSHPVSCMSWHDAKAYVAWLAKTTGKTYRLLSEAEWEYAARADTGTPYHFGTPDKLCAYGNGVDMTAKQANPGWSVLSTCTDGHVHAAPVGQFAPNDFGLHDMHGNVWEWTEDCWNETYDRAPSNGSAWLAGNCTRRVLRGGSWSNNARFLRAAYRHHAPQGDHSNNYGFRIAREL